MATPHTAELPAAARQARNIDSLRRYFRLLEEGDIDSWARLWAADGTQLVPYATGALPREVNGRDDIRTLYRNIASGFERLRYLLLEFELLADPDMMLARWRPRCELVGGGIYTNESVGLFRFNSHGEIVHFIEYFNPAGFVENYDSFSEG
ncbi:nuclear transport factor 2 family protein [Streptomyces marincola]|uniref:nuclear transport factor 2 family protein n=1 Tax=Streptomyces marincola TaxID=2878388 RepID=UPI001CF48303|nr:nuclear transport factor 2 family protein [Streptomyces marincola]UCM88153.1 nuclear transport factor 2 family protein [Streptomyces marincola]